MANNKKRQVKEFSISLTPGIIGTAQLTHGAQVLSVQQVGVNYTIWALVDPDETRTQQRAFIAVRNNTDIDIDFRHQSLKFINTFQVGAIITHFFELV